MLQSKNSFRNEPFAKQIALILFLLSAHIEATLTLCDKYFANEGAKSMRESGTK